MAGVTLTASESSTILSLQATTTLFNATSNDLNTGKKVNSAADNALAYFQSASLYNRATDFQNRKAQIDQSVQSLSSALDATSTIGTLLTQIQGVIQSAEGATSASAKTTATSQLKTLGQQLVQVVKDAQFQGINLLESTAITLRTQFSERTASALVVTGYNLLGSSGANALFTASSGAGKIITASGFNIANLLVSAGATSAGKSSFTSVFASTASGEAIFSNAINIIASAISQNNAISASIGTNVAILKARSTFSSSYASTLSTGGDKLTLADLNLESANAQALQLRQSIGIQVLSLSNTQTQSILNLLR
jgi:flagellin